MSRSFARIFPGARHARRSGSGLGRLPKPADAARRLEHAGALDRLQPMLLNMQTGGGTWTLHGVTLDQVLPNLDLIEEGSASLGAYAREMVAAAVDRGFLRPAAR